MAAKAEETVLSAQIPQPLLGSKISPFCISEGNWRHVYNSMDKIVRECELKPDECRLKWELLFGKDDAVSATKEFLSQNAGASGVGCIHIHGKHATGKNALLEAIVTAHQGFCTELRFTDIVEQYSGVAPRRLRAFIELARDISLRRRHSTMIIIDHADMLFGKGSNSNYSDMIRENEKEIIDCFKRTLEETSQGGLIVVAVTNEREDLHPQLHKLFCKEVALNLPTKVSAVQYFKWRAMHRFPVVNDLTDNKVPVNNLTDDDYDDLAETAINGNHHFAGWFGIERAMASIEESWMLEWEGSAPNLSRKHLDSFIGNKKRGRSD